MISCAALSRRTITPLLIAGAGLLCAATPAHATRADVGDRADLRIDGTRSFDGFANHELAALDFNGDGLDDVAMASPAGDGPSGNGTGIAYVVLSSHNGEFDLSNPPAGTRVRIDGEVGAGALGVSIDSAGDFNGDGYDDLVVGGPGYGVNGQGDSGKAYIIFGSETPDDVDLASAPQEQAIAIEIEGAQNDRLGSLTAGSADVNGDGLDDVVAVAAAPAQDAGRAYVVFGTTNPQDLSAPGLGSSGYRIEAAPGVRFEAVAMPGDIDTDGYGDIAVVHNSRVIVLRGSPEPTNLAMEFLEEDEGIEVLNVANADALAAAGDMDDDGYGDLAILSPQYAAILFSEGTAEDVVNLSAPAGRGLLIGTSSPITSLAAADFDGDGRDDLAVGLPQADRAGVDDPGMAAVIRGTSAPSDVALESENPLDVTRLDGSVGGHELGRTAAAGDFDGDGIGDLALGAPGTDFNDRVGSGSVYSVEAAPVCPLRADNVSVGTPERDGYLGSGELDTFVTGGGDDELRLGAGDDCGAGGDGEDEIRGGSGKDSLFGGEDRDLLSGGRGKDLLVGDAGDDRIDARGGGADDVICGPGEDVFRVDKRDRVQECERKRKRPFEPGPVTPGHPDRPENDDFADAEQVEGLPASVHGDLGGATVEAGESGAASVWYEWVAPADGAVAFDAGPCGDPLTPGLAVFRGASLDTLSREAVVADFSDCADNKSGLNPVILDAKEGVRYSISASSDVSAEFELTLTPQTRPSNDDRSSAEILPPGTDRVEVSTAGATLESGEPSSWTGSLWYVWTAPASGVLAIESCASNHDSALALFRDDGSSAPEAKQDDAGWYPGIKNTDCSAVFGRGARLAASVDEGERVLVVVGNENEAGKAVVDFALSAAPANDDLADAQEIGAEPAGIAGDNLAATAEPGASELGAASVWYRWTPSRDMPVSVRTCSSFVLTVFEGTTHEDKDQIAQKGTCDPQSARPHFDWLRFEVEAGKTYLFRVDGRRAQGDAPTRGPFEYQFILGIRNNDLKDATALEGTTFAATTEFGISDLEEGEPSHTSRPGAAVSGSVWFSWTAPESGPYRLRGSGFTRAYTGDGTIASLQAVEPAAGDPDVFEASGGKTYYLVVTQSLIPPRYSPPAGPVSISLEPAPPER